MFKEIYKKIEKYENIVIVRHIGVDPDALASQIALRDSLRKEFPEKKILATGVSSIRFNYFPSLDKLEDLENVLLIVVDTPDLKRIDYPYLDKAKELIKIDHHPVIDVFSKDDVVDTTASSASELVLLFIKESNLYLDQNIAEVLFMGIVSDTNRFLYSTSPKTFTLISDLLKNYQMNTTRLYSNIYMRPLNEVRLQGYISQNMTVTEFGLSTIILTNNILSEFKVDVGSAGNMVNMYNNIEEVIVWVTISEDLKNKLFKFNIRSRGPAVNKVAEKYNGGGHRFAAGARVKTLEEVHKLIADLDDICRIYREGEISENK